MPALVSSLAVAFQQAVESLLEQHGWHLSGIEGDDFQIWVMVRCPHNQNGVFSWTGPPLVYIPAAVLVEPMFAPLRARCENQHQHLPAANMLSTKEWWTPAAPAPLPQPSAGVAFAELVALVPALNTDVPCPACDGMGAGIRLASVITHLNDTHQWTRERIADWLDTLDVDLTVTAASKGD